MPTSGFKWENYKTKFERVKEAFELKNAFSQEGANLSCFNPEVQTNFSEKEKMLYAIVKEIFNTAKAKKDMSERDAAHERSMLTHEQRYLRDMSFETDCGNPTDSDLSGCTPDSIAQSSKADDPKSLRYMLQGSLEDFLGRSSSQFEEVEIEERRARLRMEEAKLQHQLQTEAAMMQQRLQDSKVLEKQVEKDIWQAKAMVLTLQGKRSRNSEDDLVDGDIGN
jgi:hypothetical protein